MAVLPLGNCLSSGKPGGNLITAGYLTGTLAANIHQGKIIVVGIISQALLVTCVPIIMSLMQGVVFTLCDTGKTVAACLHEAPFPVGTFC